MLNKPKNSVSDPHANIRKFNVVDQKCLIRLQWFYETRSSNIPISGVILKENAIIPAENLGMKSLQASNGWLTKFKERYGLAY